MSEPLPVPVVDDPITWCVSQALQACLCAELPVTSKGVACCCILPGADIIADSCEVGQAWIRLVTEYPLSSRFPNPATGMEPTACGEVGHGWAATFELGVLRCMPQPDERGNLPSCDEYSESARLVAADKYAMRRAIMCCDWRDTCGLTDNRIVMGAWTPLGPDGNCVGGTTNVTVELFGCICPAVEPARAAVA